MRYVRGICKREIWVERRTPVRTVDEVDEERKVLIENRTKMKKKSKGDNRYAHKQDEY